MTELESELVRKEIKNDMDNIVYYKNFNSVVEKMKSLSLKDQEDVLFMLNLHLVYAEQEKKRTSTGPQTPKIIPVDFREKTPRRAVK